MIAISSYVCVSGFKTDSAEQIGRINQSGLELNEETGYNVVPNGFFCSKSYVLYGIRTRKCN